MSFDSTQRKPGVIGPTSSEQGSSPVGDIVRRPLGVVGAANSPIGINDLVQTQEGDEVRRTQADSSQRREKPPSSVGWLSVVFTVLLSLVCVLFVSKVSVDSIRGVWGSWFGFQDLGTLDRLFVICSATYALAVLTFAGLIVFLLLRAGWRYYMLREVSMFRSQAEAFLRREQRVWTNARLARWLDRYVQHVNCQNEYTSLSGDDLENRLRNIDTCVLDKLDQNADAIILQNALGVALGTAATSAAFDVLIVLWRTFSTIEQIAMLYRGRPGFLGSLRLLRRSMYAITLAAVADQATSTIAGAVSNRALALLSGRLAQGLSNGLMVMRLGYAVKHECRPLPTEDSTTLIQQIGRLKTALFKGTAAEESKL